MSEEKTISKEEQARKDYMKLSGEFVDKKAEIMKLGLKLQRIETILKVQFDKENAEDFVKLETLQKDVEAITRKFPDLELRVAGIEKPKKDEPKNETKETINE